MTRKLGVLLILWHIICVPEAIAQDISAIGGLEVWLDADSLISISDTGVDSWSNLQNTSMTAVQPLLDRRPEYSPGIASLNGNGVLRFNGFRDHLQFAHSVTLGSVFIVVAHDLDNVPLFSGLVTKSSGGNEAIALIADELGEGFYQTGIFGSGIYVNANLGFSVPDSMKFNVVEGRASTSALWEEMVICSDRLINNRYWEGAIAEILIFDHVLSPTDSAAVYNYFHHKFTPPLQLPSDTNLTNFCPISIGPDSVYCSYSWNTGDTASPIMVDSSGVYAIEVSTQFGTTLTDSIQVIYPGAYLRPFALCTGQDSLWDTTLDEALFDFLWQDGSTDPAYLIDSPGEYAVMITDSFGCTFTSDTITVTLDTFSEDATLGPDAQLCVGNELFVMGADTTGVSYTWTGGIDTATLPMSLSGTYDVTAVNPNGCIAQDTIEVQIIGDAPVADFFTFFSCELTATSFLNGSYPPAGDVIASYAWQFGEGEGTSDLSDPDYLYEQAGDYLVQLTVTTDVGCSSTVSQVITVAPKPSAMLDVSLPCVGSETTFSDMSTVSSGEIDESLWRFDTSAFGSGAVTQFVYTEAGAYDVRLITITEFGCRDTAITTIEALNSPIASYIVEDVCLGQPSLLIAQAEENGGGAILGYLWQLDDEGLIFPEVINTFNQSGPNPFTLTVTSVTGCTDDTLGLAFVYDAPIADFSSGASCVGQPTAFFDQTITSYDDAIVSYSWDFATQSTAATPSPTHIFAQEGSYDVLLQVISSTGCTDFAEKEVEVSGLPMADFDLDPIIGLPPLEVTFTDLSVGAEQYFWTFEGVGESTESNPVYTFLNEGVQPVTLRVVNEGGCLDSISAEVFLTEPITDITLDFLSIQEQDGFLRPTILFGNLGNYRLDSVLIRVEVIGGGVLQELWTGALSPQQATTYEMSSAIFYDATADVPQICVTVAPMPGRIDVDPDNDQQCVAFGEIGQAIWERPSPNPTEGEVSIRLINADEGTLRLRLTDETGRPVIDEEVAVGQQLVDLLSYDLSRYGSGQYYMTLTQGGREETYPIIFLRR